MKPNLFVIFGFWVYMGATPIVSQSPLAPGGGTKARFSQMVTRAFSKKRLKDLRND